MNSIVIKESLYNSSFVQMLRTISPKDIRFTSSPKIKADIVFPYCANISFSILFTNQLNKIFLQQIKKTSEAYKHYVVIICISQDDKELYTDFLCGIPSKVMAVICLPHENFNLTASNFILETATNFRSRSRELEQKIESKRKSVLDPDTQARNIFNLLIKEGDVRERVIQTMINETGTIRSTIEKCLPELNECDFYLEPE
ncbi:hypothetical protein TRFO_05713 [Tritrichomonas foetus]|uniref:Uncharacterized protein n=1 Tax=Tritrichomonas foetus TaxID=1144522 RepID=A0A1J4K4E2_9EUKA|nr:hypothetical protein TRFO_05713 [Tritrichomonas foetus]|eukprot:OHT06059.1 hypothetical protein TRFO_05713 [Tritrichomonas foetus]